MAKDVTNDKEIDYSNIEEKDLEDFGENELIQEEDNENPLISKAEYFILKYYKKELEKLMNNYPKEKSLLIDYEKIELFNPTFADELLEKPEFVLEAFKIAAKKYKSSLIDEEINFEPIIRIFNLPDDKRVPIKELSSEHLGKMIAVEGIVRQFTTVLPKIKVAHWICKSCGYEIDLPQKDFNVVKPKICPECKHKDFELDEQHSEFLDYQKIEIQEPLDELKGGEQANTLQIVINDDIVNSFTAGDRLIFTGVLRLKKPDKKQTVYGKFLECVHIEKTKQDYEDVEISEEDEERIKELSKNPDIYKIVSSSIAPHIYGHEKVKEAIALQLFGGIKKILKDKSKIRGNIHILLVGDPGVGKSQIIQYATKVAPKSLYVVGKTASGAGLTATAVKDEFGEGGWTLKAGALVLASGGFAMIDEFDKMSSEDRSAMHEAMEQETVSVAKAGIVSTFKTETSVLAAANPKFGRFDNRKNFAEQIDIPPTLMSRFDLFFVLRDILDKKRDKETVLSILKTQQLGQLRANEQYDVEMDQEKKELEITPEFLKKYISYARTRIFPVLTENAMKELQKYFLKLRNKSKDGRVTITYRQLEALVRLSEASARVRLSKKVSKEDAERAIDLFKFSMEQVGMDPETGEIDIDIIATGQSHSMKNKINKILEIIENITKDPNRKEPYAKIEEIEKEAELENIDKKKVREILEKLSRSGDIYEPRPYKYAIPPKG